MFAPLLIFNQRNCRMSLASVSGILGRLKEYMYGGTKQLPIVLASTSFMYAIATGSIAHLNIILGMTVVAPVYTLIIQTILARITSTGSAWSTRSSSEMCNIITTTGKLDAKFSPSQDSQDTIPSYWLMSFALFIGYAITNAVDCLNSPKNPNANQVNYDRRNSQATMVIIATSVFAVLVLAFRFYFMSGCEGVGMAGIVLSLLFAGGAGYIGSKMYDFSKMCGARSSDLFGILSQLLPASAMAPRPVACM